MALRLVRRGNTGTSNDHNLLLNRGLKDQHTIDSITQLREELDKRYIFPLGGIPKSDIGFDVATMTDVISTRAELLDTINLVDNRVDGVEIRATAIEDFINNYKDLMLRNVSYPELVDLTFEPKIYEEFIAEANDVEFILNTNYQPGNDSLRVYKNGTLQRCGVDYNETSDTIITFVTPLESGDYVTLYSEGRTNINSPIHEEYEYVDNSTFKLAYRYNPGDNSLSVFVNGKRLNVNREYTEVDDYTVQIKVALTAGDIVVFRRETHMAAQVELLDGTSYNQKSWKEVFRMADDITDTIVLESNVYVPGTSMIQVFVQGLLQNIGSIEDYIEVNESTIKFNYVLDKDDKVEIVCNSGLYSWKETFITTNSQKVFKLSNRYYPGKEDILVYENGILNSAVDDYIEVNYNTIEFLEPPVIGSKVIIYKRR